MPAQEVRTKHARARSSFPRHPRRYRNGGTSDAILTVLHPSLSNDAGQGERGVAHRRAGGEHG